MVQLQPGERVLDIGSGPGLQAHEMAEAVGLSGQVCGVDLSESMVQMSRTRCARQSWVHLQIGDATRLLYPENSFDVAVATQVYEYVVDMTAALADLYRVVRPGGRVLILDTDWDSLVWHTTDRIRMKRVLEAWDAHLARPHLPQTLESRLKRAGFQLQKQSVFPLLNSQCNADTYSHWLIGFISPFVPGKSGVTKAEARAWAKELRHLARANSYFFSLNRYIFMAAKPG